MGAGILDRFSRLLQLSWRSGHSRRDQSASLVAAVWVDGAERPGRPSCASHSLSLLFFSRFSGCRERKPACRGLGKGGEELRTWEVGRAVSTRRKSLFFQGRSIGLSSLPPSERPSLFFIHCPSRFSALTYTLHVSGRCTAPWGGPRPPEVARAPFGPIRLVQNDNDIHQRASVSGTRLCATAAAGFAKDAGFT